MKKFKREHTVFDRVDEFTENKPPATYLSDDFIQFYKGNILALNMGESLEIDWYKITRIE